MNLKSEPEDRDVLFSEDYMDAVAQRIYKHLTQDEGYFVYIEVCDFFRGVLHADSIQLQHTFKMTMDE